ANPATVPATPPDANVYAIDNRVRDALITAAKFTKDTAQTIVEASVLLNGQSVIGTNRHVLVESWHGYTLPTGIPVPKAFIQVLEKVEAALVGFGMGTETITIHFADGTSVRTRFYTDG